MKSFFLVRVGAKRLGGLGGVIVLAMAANASSVLASTLAHKSKGLSMPSVVLTGSSTSAIPSSVWIAQDQGFFKDEGLSLSYLASPTSSAQVAILTSGSAQFEVDSPATDLPAVAQGAPIRAVMMQAQGSDGEILVTQTEATQLGIASTGDNTAQVTKQFLALKGSHIQMAVSSASSGSYGALELATRSHGMTVGIGCTTCDIDAVTVGSPANQTADFESGKVPSITGTPPTTVVSSPPAVTIQLSKYLPPLSQSAANYLGTTITMIQQHSDVVQAVVTAMVRADYWLKSHPAQAEHDAALGIATYLGITSPEEAEYLYAGIASSLPWPYPTKKAFNLAIEEADLTLSTPINVTYGSYIITKYVTKAANTLHLTID